MMAAIAFFGMVAYSSLPISDLPNVDSPTINVVASLPGADPSTMSSAVATVLERQFTGIAGLDSMKPHRVRQRMSHLQLDQTMRSV